MRMLTERPFLRAVLGGAAGMMAVLTIAGLIYAGLTLYADHVTLGAVVRYINQQTTQKTPPQP